MLVVRTPECRADSLGQLVGTEHSIGLYNLALAVDPLGLYRIEPRALLWQQAAYDPHPLAAAFNLSVVRGDPLSYTGSGCILPSMSEKRNSQNSESKRLESLYRKAADPVLRTHLLMVWRMSVGDSVGEVAEMVGYSKKWTKEIKRRYESEGIEGLGDRRHGNPGAKERALLDEEGQAQLRQALLEGSPPGGGMWSGAKVARWIAQRNGLEKVHDQRGFEYLRKVGHSPQVPRPSNAQGADASEREAFKKVLG
jgi:transposase